MKTANKQRDKMRGLVQEATLGDDRSERLTDSKRHWDDETDIWHDGTGSHTATNHLCADVLMLRLRFSSTWSSWRKLPTSTAKQQQAKVQRTTNTLHQVLPLTSTLSIFTATSFQTETSSSAIAQRPRDASCLSSTIPQARHFITSYCGFRFTTVYN